MDRHAPNCRIGEPPAAMSNPDPNRAGVKRAAVAELGEHGDRIGPPRVCCHCRAGTVRDVSQAVRAILSEATAAVRQELRNERKAAAPTRESFTVAELAALTGRPHDRITGDLRNGVVKGHRAMESNAWRVALEEARKYLELWKRDALPARVG